MAVFADKYRGRYPAAVKILLTDREGLTAYLRCAAGRHHRIRLSWQERSLNFGFAT